MKHYRQGSHSPVNIWLDETTPEGEHTSRHIAMATSPEAARIICNALNGRATQLAGTRQYDPALPLIIAASNAMVARNYATSMRIPFGHDTVGSWVYPEDAGRLVGMDRAYVVLVDSYPSLEIGEIIARNVQAGRFTPITLSKDMDDFIAARHAAIEAHNAHKRETFTDGGDQ